MKRPTHVLYGYSKTRFEVLVMSGDQIIDSYDTDDAARTSVEERARDTAIDKAADHGLDESSVRCDERISRNLAANNLPLGHLLTDGQLPEDL
jgi:hypothetical protein